jgi:colicin import membrane protein
MSTLLQPVTPPVPPQDDPFRLGWRYVKRTEPDGQVIYDQVPLTEWDLTHPEEGDFVVTNRPHANMLNYLKSVFEWRSAEVPGALVLTDHRIDWQIPGLQPLGPDVAFFTESAEWPESVGTYRVKDNHGKTQFAIEVTSPSTAKKDRNEKVALYYRAGVPLYIVADTFDESDAQYDEQPVLTIYSYQWTESGPVLRYPDPLGRLWLPGLDLWLTIAGKKLQCLMPDGSPIHGYTMERERANAAVERAEAEKQRAEAEKQRAEAEKQRADAMAAELAALKAKLNHSSPNGH